VLPREAERPVARQRELDVALAVVVQRGRRSVPRIRICLDDEPGVGPVEVAHLSLDDAVLQRPRQTIPVTQLRHDRLENAARVAAPGIVPTPL
jgi:hypothetical protein